jgi:hypothetical protein
MIPLFRNIFILKFLKNFFFFLSRKHSDSNRGINEAKFISKVGSIESGKNQISDPNVVVV